MDSKSQEVSVDTAEKFLSPKMDSKSQEVSVDTAEKSTRQGRSKTQKEITSSSPKIAGSASPKSKESDYSIYTSSPIIKAEVNRYEDVEVEDKKTVTLYVLELENQAGTKWIIYRRYSEYRDTFEALKNRIPELARFRFPNKSKFNTHAEFTKTRRISGFDEYVKILVSLHDIPQEFYNFIEPTADDLQSQKEGDRPSHRSLEPRRRMNSNEDKYVDEEPLVEDKETSGADEKNGNEGKKVSFQKFASYGIPLAIFVSLMYAAAIAFVTYYMEKGLAWGLSSGGSLLGGFWTFFLIARLVILGAERKKVKTL